MPSAEMRDGQKVVYGEHLRAHNGHIAVLLQDPPCPLGLPETLTESQV